MHPFDLFVMKVDRAISRVAPLRWKWRRIGARPTL